MAGTTGISWADSTFNPWIGCTRVSPACDDCYAARSTPARTLGVVWGSGEPRRRTSAANWKLPAQWNRDRFYACQDCSWRGDEPSRPYVTGPVTLVLCPACNGEVEPARRRVFCASLADVFDNEVDPQWRDNLFDLIEQTPNLDWLLLTKRIGNVGNMLPVPFDFARLYPNVWLGITVVNQAEADRDIPKLLAVPARVRFVSIEPMLGPIDLTHALMKCCGSFVPGHVGDGLMQPPHPPECCGDPVFLDDLHWVIAGGESGPHARPSHPDWYRSLRDQCAAAGVPFLFKQWGEWVSSAQNQELHGGPWSRWMWEDGKPFEPGDPLRGALYCRAGKKASGHLLDGVEHQAFPEPV